MKKFLALVALVAVAALSFPPPASRADIHTFRVKWSRGISSKGLGADSTRISIPAAQASDFADTTAWVDLSAFNAYGSYTQAPVLAFQINKQLTTTTDSVGYAIQYSNDPASATAAGATANAGAYFTGTTGHLTTVAATTAGITAGQDGAVGMVILNAPKTAPTNGTNTDFPMRYGRIIVINEDATGQTGRVYYTVDAVVYSQDRP